MIVKRVNSKTRQAGSNLALPLNFHVILGKILNLNRSFHIYICIRNNIFTYLKRYCED